MTRDFWLGVAVGPSIAIAIASLRFAARYLNRAGVWLVNRLSNQQPEKVYRRAQVGAIMACARRAYWLPLPFDSVLILAVGHDMKQAEPIREAIYGVVAKPVTVNPKYRRRATVEPGGVGVTDDDA